MKSAHEKSGKPVAMVGARQGTGNDDRVVAATHEGYPVLDGLPAFLRGVRAQFDYRDFLATSATRLVTFDASLSNRWSEDVASQGTLGEADSLRMLQAFGLPATPCKLVSEQAELDVSAAELGYPLALKTAEPGVMHKTDRGGVFLGLLDAESLHDAYQEMQATIGPMALLAPMAEAGVEMILGARHDPQFGPVIVLGFGGILAEVARDVCFVMPPFDAEHARRCVDKLQLRPLLDGVRGAGAYDIDAFCEAASRFSVMVDALGGAVREIDINPIIVHPQGCTAVDALVTGMERN